jgi:DNA recombination protein RmuC
MNDFFLYIGPLLFLTIGFFVGQYITRLKSTTEQPTELINTLKQDLKQARQQLDELREEHQQTLSKNVQAESDLKHLKKEQEQRADELAKLQKDFAIKFENLAQKIFEDKSKKFTDQNKENINTILKPLQDKIKTFEERVEKSQNFNIEMKTALEEQFKNLKTQNETLQKEAENLTNALKGDSKMQGNWGELILEKVLEKSGLEKDREYLVQQSFEDEEGNKQLPDVVINLPGQKHMVVDSKVSLTDYERYVNENDLGLKQQHLKKHIDSIKRHISQLSAKKYEELYELESLDFVLLFIPIETAFSTAINEENDIFNLAYSQNIVIVTPSTLLATLRTIVSLWTSEKQRKNTLEIARQAGALYDKFEGLFQDLKQIGKKLDDSKSFYVEAMNKLHDGKGNLISRVEKIKTLGAKAKKSLPENILDRAKENEE